uniref:Uncharacterized protein n=1 Tax=Suricata suricatta TaxID=37032 RepID=A0A673VGM0_SURSU
MDPPSAGLFLGIPSSPTARPEARAHTQTCSQIHICTLEWAHTCMSTHVHKPAHLHACRYTCVFGRGLAERWYLHQRD